MDLIKEINRLRKSSISNKVNKRLDEFYNLGKMDNKEWFSELCFCILTANSKASTAIEIQKELGPEGFLCSSKEGLSNCIRRNKHRFHNNKSSYIFNAREFKNIKDILKKENDPREWLVNNVKGLGWKESSHFLRNLGYEEYAILDRHIINLLYEGGYIEKKPKTLSKKIYMDIEKKFKSLANKLNMSLPELDLYMWYLKTGKILK